MICAFLAHGTHPPPIISGKVLGSGEPEFALGHAAKGMFMLLLLGRAESWSCDRRKRPGCKALALSAQTANQRTGTISTCRPCPSGWPDRPTGAIDRHRRRCWRPIPAMIASRPMKLSHAHALRPGRQLRACAASIEAVSCSAYAPDHKALRGYLMGCHAFALEETGDYAAAEAAGACGTLKYGA